ncbi:MAG: DUF3119 family protein [Oscillatoriales cyanobacterium SM2_2_1]|nr:DUF3119 family protein [Oscillatoriales cyanobacterium SM2_2_1]
MNPQSPSSPDTQVHPNYAIPITLVFLSIPLYWVNFWLCLVIALLGITLTYQTATLRLIFTSSALEIYRGSTQIRHFPYSDWQDWHIFWPALPILFYFREIKSIHFLPILFDSKTLEYNLNRHCPRKI